MIVRRGTAPGLLHRHVLFRWCGPLGTMGMSSDGDDWTHLPSSCLLLCVLLYNPLSFVVHTGYLAAFLTKCVCGGGGGGGSVGWQQDNQLRLREQSMGAYRGALQHGME